MHNAATYFRLRYIFERGITFLQPIREAEICPWTFTFSNTFGGVHYGKHRYLCLATTFHSALIPHNALPLMHYLLGSTRRGVKGFCLPKKLQPSDVMSDPQPLDEGLWST